MENANLAVDTFEAVCKEMGAVIIWGDTFTFPVPTQYTETEAKEINTAKLKTARDTAEERCGIRYPDEHKGLISRIENK